jgi:hypothetical protein
MVMQQLAWKQGFSNHALSHGHEGMSPVTNIWVYSIGRIAPLIRRQRQLQTNSME